MKEFTGRLRLGFTGAGGTGKGTLAKMVADYANLTFLPTPLAEIGTRFNMKDFKDHKTKDDVIAYQFAALHGQIYQEKGLQLAGLGYVAERTSLDYIPYWARKRLSVTAELNDVYVQTAVKWAIENYTMIIYCPPEFFPADGQTWKERDPKDQAYTDEVIRGLFVYVQDHVPIVRVKGTPDERFKQVIAGLEAYVREACPNLCGK